MVHTHSRIVVRVNNTNPTILAAAQAIVANIPNADCSHSITTQQAALTPATGYTIILADTLDQTKVRHYHHHHHHLFFSFHSSDRSPAPQIYATSDFFEVKALGAAYPPASATPTGTTSSTSSSSSGSGTASGSTSSSTNNPNSAFTSFQLSGAGVLAAVGVAIGML